MGNWSLDIVNSVTNGTTPVGFLPSGDVDLTRTIAGNLNVVLPALAQSDVLQFWKLINWIFVSLYWTSLYDLGQISPTSYATDTPMAIPPTYNIFVNPDLFAS